MVSQQLRQDVQQAIAPDIADVTVQYGATRACITVSKAAPSDVILRITRKLRAAGYTVDGPNMLMTDDNLYVEDPAADTDDDDAPAVASNVETAEVEVDESEPLLVGV